jgi:outer membrane protein OmpA-like peptidoglycan-associated protein
LAALLEELLEFRSLVPYCHDAVAEVRRGREVQIDACRGFGLDTHLVEDMSPNQHPNSSPRLLAGVLALTLSACASAVSHPAPLPPAAQAPPVVVAPEPTASVPLADLDHDRVPDVCDHCPGEPGIDRGDHPHGRGCPYVDAFQDSAAFLRDVTFEFSKSSASLSEAGVRRARELAPNLIGRDDGLRFFVLGNVSPDEVEDPTLGQRRAEAVVAALVEAGVDPAFLMAHDAQVASPVYDASRQNIDAPRSRRVTLDASRTHALGQVWNAERRQVENIVNGELETCPPEHRSPR